MRVTDREEVLEMLDEVLMYFEDMGHWYHGEEYMKENLLEIMQRVENEDDI